MGKENEAIERKRLWFDIDSKVFHQKTYNLKEVAGWIENVRNRKANKISVAVENNGVFGISIKLSAIRQRWETRKEAIARKDIEAENKKKNEAEKLALELSTYNRLKLKFEK